MCVCVFSYLDLLLTYYTVCCNVETTGLRVKYLTLDVQIRVFSSVTENKCDIKGMFAASLFHCQKIRVGHYLSFSIKQKKSQATAFCDKKKCDIKYTSKMPY